MTKYLGYIARFCDEWSKYAFFDECYKDNKGHADVGVPLVYS